MSKKGWSDAARSASAVTRRAHAKVRLAGWNSSTGKGNKFPLKGSFGRESLAQNVKFYRALVRGKATAKMIKQQGPIARPPKKVGRLTGVSGAKAWNAFTASGYRKWKI